MQERSLGDRLFLTGMVLSMTCWGFSWASGKVLAGYGSPITIAFFRFALTFISLPFVIVLLKAKLQIQKKGLVDLILASLLMSVYIVLFFKGLAEGQAGAGGVLVTVLNPIIAYGIMLILNRRKPTRNESFGLLVGVVAGVVLLKLTSNIRLIFLAGNVYFLLAALAWASLSHFTARSTRYGSPVAFSFWLYGISTFVMLLCSGVQPTLDVYAKTDFKFWSNLFFSATVTSSMATTFYFAATSKIGASKASSFIFMVPFSAALGSWIFLQESIEFHTMVGGTLGIVAVYILNKRETPKYSDVQE